MQLQSPKVVVDAIQIKSIRFLHLARLDVEVRLNKSKHHPIIVRNNGLKCYMTLYLKVVVGDMFAYRYLHNFTFGNSGNRYNIQLHVNSNSNSR